MLQHISPLRTRGIAWVLFFQVPNGDADKVRLGIMQPYFLPYIGYWQLLSAVDSFVLYDNIQYTKKGWINRNRFLLNGQDALFTIPLKRDSDYLDVVHRWVADDFDGTKLLRQLESSYRKAPFFNEAFPVFAEIINNPERNLFEYIRDSIERVAAYLAIGTPIIVSSSVDIDHSLRGEEKVIATCRSLGAKIYINTIGGKQLYSVSTFKENGIDLQFIETNPLSYQQFGGEFVSNLSIVDVMMFNSRKSIVAMLAEFTLV